MPEATAGMEAGMPTSVSAAGWVGMTESAAGWEVAAAGWPVTTPRELVCWRKVVWGKGSTEEDWAKAAAAKAVTAKAVRILMVVVLVV